METVNFTALSERQDTPAYIAHRSQKWRGYATFRRTDEPSLSNSRHNLIQAENLTAALSSRYEIDRQEPYIKLPRQFVKSVAAQHTRAALTTRQNIAFTAVIALAFDTATDDFTVRLREVEPFIRNFSGSRVRGIHTLFEDAVSTATACGLGIFRIIHANRQSITIRKTLTYFAAIQGCKHYSRIPLAAVPKIETKYGQRLFYRTAFRASYGDEFLRPLTLSITALRRTLGCLNSYSRNFDFLRRAVLPAVEDVSEHAETFFLRLEAVYERTEGQRGRAGMAGFKINIAKLSDEREDTQALRKRYTKWHEADVSRVRKTLTDFRKSWEAGAIPQDAINGALPGYHAVLGNLLPIEDQKVSLRAALSAYTLVLQNALSRRSPERIEMPRPGPDDYFGSAITEDIMQGRTGSEIFVEWCQAAIASGWIHDLVGTFSRRPFPPADSAFVLASKLTGFWRNLEREKEKPAA